MAHLSEIDSTLRAIASRTPNLVFGADMDDNLTYVNPKFCETLDLDEQEILGKKIHELETIGASAREIMTRRHLVLAGETITREVAFTLPDGHQRTYDVLMTSKHDEENRLNGVAGLFRDITDEKNLQAELALGRQLLNCASDAIVIRDVNDNILFWNRSAERIYGYSANEMVGQRTITFNAKGKSDIDDIQNMISVHDEWSGELQHKRKDGTEITVQCRRSLLRNDKGDPIGILFIDTDITEKKNLERQYLRAQRLECLGTLAAGITHDLNNILTPIILGTEVIRHAVTDNNALRTLETVEASARRGAEIIKEVLSFARGIEGIRTTVQVRHLVNEIEKMVKETFPRTITVTSDLQKDLWTVSGDPTQLHQVLMNLSVNAKDAMPRGGKLEFKARNIVLDDQYVRMNIEAKTGPHILVSVSDTGCGIPQDIVDKIFEPFFTTKKPGEGTGLGLSTVQSIVKSHGGFINVYSEMGKGTEFKVYLPAHITNANGVRMNEKDMLPDGNEELILVVDDEAAIREITRDTLEAHGYRVLTAGDGTEALSIYAERKSEIAALISDLVMPYMDGLALLRALQKMDPSIRVIAMSGMLQDHQLAIQIGAWAFLHKPFTASTLLTTLREVLDLKK